MRSIRIRCSGGGSSGEPFWWSIAQNQLRIIKALNTRIGAIIGINSSK